MLVGSTSSFYVPILRIRARPDQHARASMASTPLLLAVTLIRHDIVDDIRIRIASIADTFCKVCAHTGRLVTIPCVLIKPGNASWSDQPIVRVQEIETVSRDGA